MDFRRRCSRPSTKWQPTKSRLERGVRTEAEKTIAWEMAVIPIGVMPRCGTYFATSPCSPASTRTCPPSGCMTQTGAGSSVTSDCTTTCSSRGITQGMHRVNAAADRYSVRPCGAGHASGRTRGTAGGRAATGQAVQSHAPPE